MLTRSQENELERCLADLRAVDVRIPRELRLRFRKLRRVAAPRLIELVERRFDDCCEWDPSHAVEMLGEIRSVEAIPLLLECLADHDDTWLARTAQQALVEIGPSVLEPALEAHDAMDFEDERIEICEVLAKLGVQDERIYARLMAAFDHAPWTLVPAVADYGDPRALEALGEALDAHRVGLQPADWPGVEGIVFELVDAIEGLGGSLTPCQARKLQAAKKRREAYLEQSGHSPNPDATRITGAQYHRCSWSNWKGEPERSLAVALRKMIEPLVDNYGGEISVAVAGWLIDVARVAWTYEVDPSLAEASCRDDPELAKQVEEFGGILEFLRDRKRALFASDGRIIVRTAVTRTEDDFEIEAVGARVARH